MHNQGYKVRVNDQQVISSKRVTCLSEGGDWNYLVEISFRVELRWQWIAQGRCLQDELVFRKVLMMLRDGFWVVILNWKGLNLKNWIFVFNGGNRFCSRVYLDLQAWFFSETSSTIHREGYGVVLEGEWSDLIKKVWWLESCLSVTCWGSVVELLTCFSLNSVCFHFSTKKEGQWRLDQSCGGFCF